MAERHADAQEPFKVKGIDTCCATEICLPVGALIGVKTPLDMVCPKSTANDTVGELI